MFFHLLANSESAFNLLSDDENSVITAFRNNIFVGDKRNPTKHPINNAWQVWEGAYTDEWKKNAPIMENGRCILKKVQHKAGIAAVAFMTGGYKKAIKQYTDRFKKGTANHTKALSFHPMGFKRQIVNSDSMLQKVLLKANPYRVEGFGFPRIEEFVNEPEYEDHYLPSANKTKYYLTQGLTRIKDTEYYTPLCLGFLTWNSYYHTGYIVLDYMPEYLNMEAWSSTFKAMINDFFRQMPETGLLFKPSEDFERDYCMKLGFRPADLDPKNDMSEYILYAKDFRNAD